MDYTHITISESLQHSSAWHRFRVISMSHHHSGLKCRWMQKVHNVLINCTKRTGSTSPFGSKPTWSRIHDFLIIKQAYGCTLNVLTRRLQSYVKGISRGSTLIGNLKVELHHTNVYAVALAWLLCIQALPFCLQYSYKKLRIQRNL